MKVILAISLILLAVGIPVLLFCDLDLIVIDRIVTVIAMICFFSILAFAVYILVM